MVYTDEEIVEITFPPSQADPAAKFFTRTLSCALDSLSLSLSAWILCRIYCLRRTLVFMTDLQRFGRTWSYLLRILLPKKVAHLVIQLWFIEGLSDRSTETSGYAHIQERTSGFLYTFLYAWLFQLDRSLNGVLGLFEHVLHC